MRIFGFYFTKWIQRWLNIDIYMLHVGHILSLILLVIRHHSVGAVSIITFHNSLGLPWPEVNKLVWILSKLWSVWVSLPWVFSAASSCEVCTNQNSNNYHVEGHNDLANSELSLSKQRDVKNSPPGKCQPQHCEECQPLQTCPSASRWQWRRRDCWTRRQEAWVLSPKMWYSLEMWCVLRSREYWQPSPHHQVTTLSHQSPRSSLQTSLSSRLLTRCQIIIKSFMKYFSWDSFKTPTWKHDRIKKVDCVKDNGSSLWL